jgi:hypothetical protein
MADEDFMEFPKIARLQRDIIVTEKIDGTNAQVFIIDTRLLSDPTVPAVAYINGYAILAGSRTKYIVPGDDNHGFATWVKDHAEELVKLGPGRHFGEWWGSGIQRGYGLPKGEKKWSLFNTTRWSATGDGDPPACCNLVPVLYRGIFDMGYIEDCLTLLRERGSSASPGFMKPEGVVVFHSASNMCFKRTIEKDQEPKSLQTA